MESKAKFRYSASEGLVELEGSEEFVSKHFQALSDLVRVVSRHVTVEQKLEDKGTPSVQPKITEPVVDAVEHSAAGKGGIDSHPDFYSEINGKLKIVADIPGKNKSAKMSNAAILYCYGSKLLGDEQVPSKDIRSTIEEHGCLDGPNFSKIFSDKTIFLVDGTKGGNKEVKLTFQGEKRAKELLSSAESDN